MAWTDGLLTFGVHHIWQGAVLFGAATVLARVRKRWTSEQRTWIWVVALVGMALLPLSAYAPRLGPAGHGAARAHATPVPVDLEPAAHEFRVPRTPSTRLALRDRVGALLVEPLPHALGRGLAIFWLAGAAWCLLRLLLAQRTIDRILHAARPLPLDHPAMPDRVPSGVPVLVSDHTTVPMALGLFRPCVILPVSLVAGETPVRIQHVILHELAHVKRGDVGTLIVERLLLALMWWSPVLHAVVRRIHEAREMACDDRAVFEIGDPAPYVDALLGCAEKLAASRHTAAVTWLTAGVFSDTHAFARRPHEGALGQRRRGTHNLCCDVRGHAASRTYESDRKASPGTAWRIRGGIGRRRWTGRRSRCRGTAGCRLRS